MGCYSNVRADGGYYRKYPMTEIGVITGDQQGPCRETRLTQVRCVYKIAQTTSAGGDSPLLSRPDHGSDTLSLNAVALQIAFKFFPQFSSGTRRQVQNYRAVVHLSFDSER
jgi:hypothetical protein